MKPRVRFLVHGAERSGPPIYMLRLLREWKRRPPAFDAEVVLARPGPLEAEFRDLCPTFVTRLDRNSIDYRSEQLLRRAMSENVGQNLRNQLIRTRVRSEEPDITIINGATEPTATLLRALKPDRKVKTIAHELSTGWFSNISAQSRVQILETSGSYLAVSKSVSTFLQSELGIAADHITICRPPVDLPPNISPPHSSSFPFTIGGGGVHDWRKAPELWLQFAFKLRERVGADQLKFAWFGGNGSGQSLAWPLQHEVTHLGLGDDVEFVGEIKNTSAFYRNLDLFVSTAREDAFPLVCAEASAHGVPVLTFDSGGAAELVQDSGCGRYFRYPNTDQVADCAADLMKDKPVRTQLGKNGFDFASKHLAVEQVAPRVADWILSN